jgi:hypothetical protein
VGQIAGVRQAGKNVLSRQSGIVDQEVVLGLAGCEEFQNELDGETRPRITGLPARTSGSTMMRSESGIPTVYRANP